MRQQSGFASVVQSRFVYIFSGSSKNSNRFARIGFSQSAGFRFLSSQLRGNFAEKRVLFFCCFRGYSVSRSRNRSGSRVRSEICKTIVKLSL